MQSLPPIVEEGTSSDDESFVIYDEQFARQSEHQDASFHAPPSSLPPPVPLYAPFPTLAVSNFLTDDDGASLIEEDDGDELPDEAVAVETLTSAAASSSLTLRLSRTRSGSSSTTTSTITPSTSRIARMSSLFSVDSVAQHFTARAGEKSFQLADFCKLIDAHPSLERAKILSVECYKEPIRFGVVHRTLIFHLRRKGRTDIWMRVDRRRSHSTSPIMFALRGGRTEANDVALLAGTKADLLDRCPAVLENRIEFDTPPNLGVFRFCLQVICEELLEYHIWPANCWFMCSLLQEHLFETGYGLFKQGSHIRLNLAPRIRAKVRNRVWHVVTPSTPSITEGHHTGENASTPLADDVPQWKTLDGGLDTRDFDFSLLATLVDGLLQTIEQHHGVIAGDGSRDDLRASIIELAGRAIRLEFILRQQTDVPSSSRAFDFLSTHPTYLSRHASAPLHLPFLGYLRHVYRIAPDTAWRDIVSRLVHTARIVSRVNPAAARECATEVQTIITTHSEGSPRWTKGQRLEAHTGEVNCVAFSPDGKQIASASDDKTIRRWDALTGESIGEPMRGRTSVVFGVVFSPGGTQIVSASRDNTLRRWSASSGEPIGAPMRGHALWVHSVAYSPDGKFVVSGSADRTVRRWDASTGQTVGQPLEGHTDWVRSVAFSPNGKQIVSGSYDQTIRLWDAITGEAVGEPWKGHTAPLSSIAFSPDGRSIVSGSWDKTVRRWDALTGESIGEPITGHAASVNCVAVSPDGKEIASASMDHTIRIWDATTGEQNGEPLKGHRSSVWSVAFSPDGRQIVSGSEDHTVRIWDSLEDLDRWTQSV